MTALLGAYAFTHIRFNVDPNSFFSADLRFQKAIVEFQKYFQDSGAQWRAAADAAPAAIASAAHSFSPRHDYWATPPPPRLQPPSAATARRRLLRCLAPVGYTAPDGHVYMAAGQGAKARRNASRRAAHLARLTASSIASA